MTDKQEAQVLEDLDNLSKSENLKIPQQEIETISTNLRTIVEQNSYLGKTKEFMTCFNQQVNEAPTKPSRDLMKLRLSLILEELTELAEACGSDVLSDFQRMLFEKSEKVHIIAEKGRENIQFNTVEIFDALLDLQYVLSGAVHTFGMANTFDEGFEEVHESNISKLCVSEEEAIETYNKYSKEGIDTYVKNEEHYWIVLRKSDNKVLKSINYKPAQLKEIVEKS